MRERILAVAGALALIALAVVVRITVFGDDGGDGGGSPGQRGSGDRPVVACTPDLVSVCSALAAAGAIAADPPRLDLAGAAAPDVAIEAWITWDPAPGIANFDAPDTWSSSEVLASAPLVVLSADGPGSCTATASWSCVVEEAESSSPVGIGSPVTAEGLARLYPVARSLVPADGDFRGISSQDLSFVVDSSQVGQASAERQLTTFLTRRGALRLVVGPLPAVQRTQQNQRAGAATSASPRPPAEMTVVVATRAGSATVSAESMLSRPEVGAALTDLGVTPGQGALAPDDRAGELHAVRGKLR